MCVCVWEGERGGCREDWDRAKPVQCKVFLENVFLYSTEHQLLLRYKSSILKQAVANGLHCEYSELPHPTYVCWASRGIKVILCDTLASILLGCYMYMYMYMCILIELYMSLPYAVSMYCNSTCTCCYIHVRTCTCVCVDMNISLQRISMATDVDVTPLLRQPIYERSHVMDVESPPSSPDLCTQPVPRALAGTVLHDMYMLTRYEKYSHTNRNKKIAASSETQTHNLQPSRLNSTA